MTVTRPRAGSRLARRTRLPFGYTRQADARLPLPQEDGGARGTVQRALKHVRQAEGRVAKREVRVTAREQLAPVLNHEACQLALHAAAVVQTATRLAAHQLGDDFNERTASTTTEARKSAPRAAHCPAPVPPSDALTAFRVGCFCAQSRR